MLRAHKIRLYPTKEQEAQLKKAVGVPRYVYNWGLAEWKKAYDKGEKPSACKLDARWTKERPEWAKETCRAAQTRALLNLGKAYTRFIQGKASCPKFHKKGHKDTFYVNNVQGYIKCGRFYVPRIGHVKLAEELRFSGKIMGYTVSTYADQWYVAVQVELVEPVQNCHNPKSVVGVDVGTHRIAVASDGAELCPPKRLARLAVKMRNMQKALSRSKRNSKNHQRKLKKLQKAQNKINNIRQDVTHKFTSTVTKNHGIVVIESLNIQEMMKKAKFKRKRRSLSNSLMGIILSQLSYKALELRKVDRFFPSSKLCSNCGHKKETLGLEERTYKCEHCGAVIDRDLNAAINLCKAGMVNPSVPVETAVGSKPTSVA